MHRLFENKKFFFLRKMNNLFLYLSFRSGPDSDVGSVDDLPIDDEDVGSSDKVTTQLSNKSTSKD